MTENLIMDKLSTLVKLPNFNLKHLKHIEKFSFQIWLHKSTLVLLILAVSCNGFRFQTEESETTEEKLTGVETVEKVEKVDPEPIVPEYEDDETEAKTRQEKKIDPLVIDVERKPIDENTDGEPKDPSEQEVEGRFFLKDKLCALGLADVSSLSQYDSYIS